MYKDKDKENKRNKAGSEEQKLYDHRLMHIFFQIIENNRTSLHRIAFCYMCLVLKGAILVAEVCFDPSPIIT